MKWLWLFVIVMSVISIGTSDASKRNRWQEKADDVNAPNVDRIGDMATIAIAIWQSIALWGPR